MLFVSRFSILDCDYVVIAERTYHNKVHRTIVTVPASFLGHSFCFLLFYNFLFNFACTTAAVNRCSCPLPHRDKYHRPPSTPSCLCAEDAEDGRDGLRL